MADPYNLERFVVAQDCAGTRDNYEAAIRELRAGRKTSHWMWWVFPQLRGLGNTDTADRYGIGSRQEAEAYLEHEVLGPRLHRCAQLVARSGAVSAKALLGSVDVLKLKSSMTLFAEVADDDSDFVAVLRRYYPEGRDQETLKRLKPASTATTALLQSPSMSRARRRFWPSRRRTS
jgi:uncharacterized protein (DUF1810 family)